MKKISWYIWPLLIAASIPALIDVGVFLIGLTPAELYKVDSYAVESILFDEFRYGFSFWHMLSMLVLEFTAIQLVLMKRFRLDRAQSPWILLSSSLRQGRLLITPGQYFKLWREELLQKIVWLCAAFIVVFLSRVNRNLFLLYGGLIVLCIIMALLWKTKMFWRHKNATKHYALAGGIQFITVTALSWHYGIPAGILAYVASDILLCILLFIALRTIPPQSEQTDAPAAVPSSIYVSLWGDKSGSMNGSVRDAINAIKHIVKELNESEREVFIQLGLFGNDDVNLVRNWCPASEMTKYVDSPTGLARVYNANGGTPLNQTIVHAKNQLTKISDGMPVAIIVTDGAASDGRYESEAQRACRSIENDMDGVCAIAGVGGADTSYMARVTTSADRYKSFYSGNFAKAARDIVAGIKNVSTHGRKAEFFYLA